MDQRNPATLASISKAITRPSMPRPLKTFYRGEPMALGVKGMLGMNVVSAVAAGVGIVMLSGCLLLSAFYHLCDSYYTRDIPPEIRHETFAIPHISAPCRRTGQIIQSEEGRRNAVMFNITVILLVFTILEFLIAITGAAFGCASVCLNDNSETTVVVFQNAAQGAPPAFPVPAKVDEVP